MKTVLQPKLSRGREERLGGELMRVKKKSAWKRERTLKKRVVEGINRREITYRSVEGTRTRTAPICRRYVFYLTVSTSYEKIRGEG